jgi:hypothetical protein
MDALITLGCGDMRRSLNILQVSLFVACWQVEQRGWVWLQASCEPSCHPVFEARLGQLLPSATLPAVLPLPACWPPGVQSCHMANELVDEKSVYLTTGNPLPSDIEAVVNWLLNEPFVTAFQSECEARWGFSFNSGHTGALARLHSSSLLTHCVCPLLHRCCCRHADISKLQTERGVALVDIVRELHP